MSNTSQTVSEVVIQRAGRTVLARVLTQYDIPGMPYPKSGVWSYLIHTPKGIVIFDTGPYWQSLLGFPGKRTGNTKRIMTALDRYFPGQPAREILISHYHYDHLGNAADLQAALKTTYGNTAPIRLHAYDLRPKRFLHMFPDSYTHVLRASGCPSYTMGRPLKDGERIEGSDFSVVHTPGHTTGTVALRSDRDKIIIAGWWTEGIFNNLINVSTWIVNEDKKQIPQTIKKITVPGFRYLYYHKVENIY